MIADKSAKPAPLPVIAENIPDMIKNIDRWVVWKYVPKGKKWDKPPLQTNGQNAKSNDPQTWCSYTEAMRAYKTGTFDGIGFVLGEHNGIRFVGVDLDDHVVNGQLDADARFAVEVLQSYSERSPSGNGIKTIAIGKKIAGKKVDEKNGYEFYDGGRYFTITGHRLEDSPTEIHERPDEIEYVHTAFFPPSLNGESRSFGGDDRALAVSAIRALDKKRASSYSSWVGAGQAAHSVSDDLLPEWDKFSKQCPEKYVEGECEKKWNTFSRNRGPENSITIGSLIHWAKQDGWVPPKKTYRRTDLGNAERMAAQYRNDILYCGPFKKWSVWDSLRWCEDRKGEITQIAKRVVRSMYSEASKIEDEDKRKALASFAAKSESVARIDAMIKLCRSEVPILPEQFDQHPMLLNCPNGTVDLATGKLRPHRREDYLAKLCPTNYNPDATSFVWDQTLEKIFNHKQESLDFFCRVFGYSLTGDISEQIVLIPWGDGSNGKSTVIKAIADTIGYDYAMFAGPELLVFSKQQRHSTERMSLFGKRLVICSETEEGHRLSESFLKQLTGSERIRGRFCNQDDWEFEATHKFILQTNHRPVVRGDDHAIWRRLALFPFEVRFWNPDKQEKGPEDLRQNKHLPKKLKAESEGILAWLVKGCLEWQSQGLNIPEYVSQATKDYQRDEDILGAFLADRCVINPNVKARASDLYQEYKKWADTCGEYCASQRRFGRQLSEKGFKRFTNNGTWYEGLGIIH